VTSCRIGFRVAAPAAQATTITRSNGTIRVVSASTGAAHALAMMLTLSKRITESDRRMRAGPTSRATPLSAASS